MGGTAIVLEASKRIETVITVSAAVFMLLYFVTVLREIVSSTTVINVCFHVNRSNFCRLEVYGLDRKIELSPSFKASSERPNATYPCTFELQRHTGARGFVRSSAI
jgi:hypothetical protein